MDQVANYTRGTKGDDTIVWHPIDALTLKFLLDSYDFKAEGTNASYSVFKNYRKFIQNLH